MPIINQEKLQDYKIQISEAEEQTRARNIAHNEALLDERETTKKFKITSIILGILALLGIAGTAYFMLFNNNQNTSTAEHQQQVEALQSKISNLEETIQTFSGDDDLENNNDAYEGKPSLKNQLVYAVQIGAYRGKDLSLYSDKFINFKEVKGEDFNRYSLGNFTSLNEAKEFRKEIIKLGLKNAFIASYQNGTRVKIEEAW